MSLVPVAHPLTAHHDARGRLVVLLAEGMTRWSAPQQIYYTTLFPGLIKAWHRHQYQTDGQTCVAGMVRIVVVSDAGQVWQWVSGERAPVCVEIPPGLWHGIQELTGVHDAVVVNGPDRVYDELSPDEERRPWDDPTIPFEWQRRHG